MAKTKQQKQVAVDQLTERLQRMKTVIFTNFDGLNVHDATELRNTLRQQGVEYTVTKRTLLKRALAAASLQEMPVDLVTGGLGVAVGFDDEIVPAKALALFAKTHPALKLVGGIFSGKYISAAEVKTLAAMPSHQEMVGQLVWLIGYPVSGFVNVLAGTLRSFITVLKATSEKKTA